MEQSIQAETQRLQNVAKQARALIRAIPIDVPRDHIAGPDMLGLCLLYACHNRCLDLFDDSIQLLSNGRHASAAITGRAFIETLGFLSLELQVLRTTPENLLEDEFLRLCNSSKFKFDLQRKSAPKPGEVYTPDALARFGESRSAPVSSTGAAVRALEWFLNENIDASAGDELYTIYCALCEWAHPSQTSLMHAYTPMGGPVPTSRFGLVDEREACGLWVVWTLANISILWIVAKEIEKILHARLQAEGVSLLSKFTT